MVCLAECLLYTRKLTKLIYFSYYDLVCKVVQYCQVACVPFLFIQAHPLHCTIIKSKVFTVGDHSVWQFWNSTSLKKKTKKNLRHGDIMQNMAWLTGMWMIRDLEWDQTLPVCSEWNLIETSTNLWQHIWVSILWAHLEIFFPFEHPEVPHFPCSGMNMSSKLRVVLTDDVRRQVDCV